MTDRKEDASLKPGSGYQTKPVTEAQISINSQQPIASLPAGTTPPKPKPKG